MTPAARIEAAIDLLVCIDADSAPAERVLSHYLRERRYIGSKDRRAIGDRFYRVLRARARLDWWLARANSDVDSRHRVLAALALIEGLKVPEVAALFDGAAYHPAPLDKSERTLLDALIGAALDDPAQSPWVRAECPEWLWPEFELAFGAAAETELKALLEEASLDLRVNSLKGERDAALAALADDGIEARPTLFSPLGLRVAGRANLITAGAFTRGLVEVQDEGSQLVALVTDARPGMVVLDLCAGAGGKTLALAAAMANSGRLFALDIERRRLDRAGQRLKRAGVGNVVRHRLKRVDGSRDGSAARELAPEDQDWLARRAGSFERVLVDAPCSGSGAWRRHPDARWRLSPEALNDYRATQARVLAQAAPMVAGGGRLIYATCSLLPSENEAQVERFLAERPDFALCPMDEVWAETVAAMGGPEVPEPPPFHGPYLYLTPARHGTDGFFAAVLERRKRA